jgi:glycogen operon protein
VPSPGENHRPSPDKGAQTITPDPIDLPTIRAGEPYPLGATFDGTGTNFSVFSRVAERVELCLFDVTGREIRLDLPEMTGYSWHGYLPGVGPGQRYGFRVHGRWDPAQGLRCNPNKLLLDPYARAIEGAVRWDEAVYGHVPAAPLRRSELDSASFVPRSIITSEAFDWGGEVRPRVPDHETVIYETHVKGFTSQHPAIPEAIRGRYAALAHPAAIGHLTSLGITSVELLPVHQFIHQGALLERGLHNYWGYDSIGYFAPHAEYAASGSGGQQVDEFKSMVKALHAAGLEVILDVVYNHTAEGGPGGPTLSLRGLDNQAYYRLLAEDPSRYQDYTGTGNSLNMLEPHVLQLIMDSLRYWIEEMHVDGFRFDLASALARELHAVDRLSAFFDIIQQDPVIRTVKLIAEPWDVGEGGYQVGEFPAHWSEWNGRYRDTVRDLWRGKPDMLADLGRRFTGSADLYQDDGRRPSASVNLVTSHDGFTLADLVSYERKHNEANGEGGRDGESDNRSWNCGVEGPTHDPEVLALRTRQRRNLLATLFLSQGVPMLLGGDELGRTQQGNNNAYCQDSELSWYDWESVDPGLLAFTRRLIDLRRSHPVFRRRRWFRVGVEDPDDETAVRDIDWYRPAGGRMPDDGWHGDVAAAIAIFISGDHLVDGDGLGLVDDSFYLCLNARALALEFRLPPAHLGTSWARVMDTALADPFDDVVALALPAESALEVTGRSLVLLRRVSAAVR